MWGARLRRRPEHRRGLRALPPEEDRPAVRRSTRSRRCAHVGYRMVPDADTRPLRLPSLPSSKPPTLTSRFPSPTSRRRRVPASGGPGDRCAGGSPSSPPCSSASPSPCRPTCSCRPSSAGSRPRPGATPRPPLDKAAGELAGGSVDRAGHRRTCRASVVSIVGPRRPACSPPARVVAGPSVRPRRQPTTGTARRLRAAASRSTRTVRGRAEEQLQGRGRLPARRGAASVTELSSSLWVGIPLLVVLVGVAGVVCWSAGRCSRSSAMRREVDEISHSTLHRRIDEPATGRRGGPAGPHHERHARPPRQRGRTPAPVRVATPRTSCAAR